MGVLRAIGYFFASLILIIGILMLPIGIVAIIPAIIWMYFLHKGGQVTSMQKELKKIRMMEEEKQRLDLERRRDALSKGWD
jgi:predicted membrane protein